MPSWIRVAAIGATITASRLPAPPRRSPPPKNIPIHAIIEIEEAIAATIEEVNVSRFFTCASSCPSTARSSRSESNCRIPAVTATAACEGLRPVAKALGCIASMT